MNPYFAGTLAFVCTCLSLVALAILFDWLEKWFWK